MKILVINCGSSSLKYQLLDMSNEEALAKGIVDRIGMKGSVLTQKANGKKYVVEQEMKDHKEAIKLVLESLVHSEFGVIKDLKEVSAVGHRIVHGGEKYSESVIVDQTVIDNLEACSDLAPLHTPANLTGIYSCRELMPNTPMTVVFDTAFHQTLEKVAYLYPIPYEYYTKYGVRKYGFHGTSHRYVSAKAAELVSKNIEDLKIITCHLGNGSSVSAVKGGKCIETSMGFTPLDGVAMGTRSGSIDPAIVTYLIEKLNITASEMNNILNKKSGVLGISGISSDFRDLEEAAFAGNADAQLALDIYHYKVRQTIGAYAATMGGVDVLVFTAGLGENAGYTRSEICKGLEFLGIKIDEVKNDVRAQTRELGTEDSAVRIFTILTEEELMIARDTKKIIEKL